ncbi:hypothetical protein AB0F20_09795 [Streptomyces goshikiensis]
MSSERRVAALSVGNNGDRLTGIRAEGPALMSGRTTALNGPTVPLPA